MLKQMNLKHILLLPVILVAISFLYSCNDNDSVSNYSTSSKDARIYHLGITGTTPISKIDTITYPILIKTKFAIDETRQLVYNPDSLPYGITLASFKTKMAFNPKASPSVLALKYLNRADSIWNGLDSINYISLRGFKITAADGLSSREYRLEVRIHQIDPDIIAWNKRALPTTSFVADRHKVLLKDDDFYCFSFEGTIARLSTLSRTLRTWTDLTLNNFPATIRLESITLFNDTFYAVDDAGKSYSSTDGSTWLQQTCNMPPHSILGILPGQIEGDDKILSVVDNAGEYRYAITTDMANFEVLTVKGSPSGGATDVPTNFLSSGFTSVSDYRAEKAILITGGKDFGGKLKNTTWSLVYRNNELERMETNQFQGNKVFTAKENISTFMYDNKLYAANDSVFAISKNWGAQWVKAPEKQDWHPNMPVAEGYSVIVDKENYLWIFSGIPQKNIGVWTGRLNRLNPRK